MDVGRADRLRAAVDGRFDEEVACLARLIRTRSDVPPGDSSEIAEVVADQFEALGYEVERHAVPEPYARQHRLKAIVNLIVRRRFGDGTGPIVALQSHGDVVPAGAGWSVDPHGGEVRRGAIWGRGAAVSKSDIACYAFALDAVARAAADEVSGTVELHVTFDEEAGGHVGPQWLIAQGLTRPDYVVAGGFSNAITTVHAGCLHLEAVVSGRAAHAAMPEEGADALEAATGILVALYAERDRLADIVSAEPGIGSAKLTVGTVAAGLSINVVPDRVVIRLDRRLLPEESGEAVEAGLVALVEQAVADQAGIAVECRRLMLAEPLRPQPGVDRLVDLIRGHAEAVLGVPVEPSGAPLYSDGRHYAAAGIPTVLYGAGPRSVAAAGAYGPDEHLALSDLRAATHVVALTLADLLRPRG